jgi:hypothetical protein
MGYYLRYFAVSDERVPLGALRASAGNYRIESNGPDEDWSDFTLLRPDGVWVVAAARDISSSKLFREEIAEFDDALADAKPVSGASWVRDYLKKVAVIYAFQINTAQIEQPDWDQFYAIRNVLRNRVPGIGHSDGEGFSNEDDYHVTWDFSDRVKGTWWMAVRETGEWKTFNMDLGDERHRAAFRMGRVPDGARLGQFDA